MGFKKPLRINPAPRLCNIFKIFLLFSCYIKIMYYICFMVHNKKEYFKGLFLEAISNPQITTKHDWNQRNGYTPVNFWIDGEKFLLQLGISYDSMRHESGDRDIPTTFESKHSIEIWKVYAMTQQGDEYELELNNEEESKVTYLINSKIWL